jgi:hypothetical protein
MFPNWLCNTGPLIFRRSNSADSSLMLFQERSPQSACPRTGHGLYWSIVFAPLSRGFIAYAGPSLGQFYRVYRVRQSTAPKQLGPVAPLLKSPPRPTVASSCNDSSGGSCGKFVPASAKSFLRWSSFPRGAFIPWADSPPAADPPAAGPRTAIGPQAAGGCGDRREGGRNCNPWDESGQIPI